MYYGLIDLQQIRQNLGLSSFHVPSKAEVEDIRKRHFQVPPIKPSKMPTLQDLNAAGHRANAAASTMSMFYKSGGYSVGDLVFDLVLDEDHAFSSTISTHPVEGNTDIADHIQKQLRVGKLKGLISNHSIRHTEKIDRTNTTRSGAYGAGRAGAAWEICRTIWESQAAVQLVTSLDVYNSVGIKDFTTTRDPSTGEALEISVTFQEIRKVGLQKLRASAVVGPKDTKTPISRQTSVTVDQGRAVGETVTMDLGEMNLTGVVK